MNKMTRRRRTQDEQARLHGSHHHHGQSVQQHHQQAHGHQQQHQQQQDDDFIPLPIQTFLWRQTSPFVRPFLGKARDLAQIEQRDACKLFERIIITNNIWGQSPSLTNAISSIDRWRLIKVSFPFVLQCTAALLNNKLIRDRNFNRLGGNEAKMMYTLQWILMNASEECADSENEAKSNATHVAMAAATAASLLKPTESNTAGGASSLVSSSSHQFGAGVNSQASQSSQLSGQLDRQQQQSATVVCPPTNHSFVLPVAATAVAIGQPAGLSSLQASTLQQQQQHQSQNAPAPSSSSSVSPIGSSTPTNATTGPGAQTAPQTATTSGQQAAYTGSNLTGPPTPTPAPNSMPSKYLLPISSIQMFAYYFGPIMDGLKHSDFLSSNQRLEIGAALWEPLFNYQLPDIHCLRALVKRDSNREALEKQMLFGEAALKQQQQPWPVGAQAATASATAGTSSGQDRRRSSSVFNDSAHFGDVFLGGPAAGSSSQAAAAAAVQDEPIASRAATVIATVPAHMEQSIILTKSSSATYLDVAILRCLFIGDWQESGVFWAINYLANRFNEELYASKEADEKSKGETGEGDDETVGRGRAAQRKFALRAKSKSLSRITSEDLRKSLGLRRRQFKRRKQNEKTSLDSRDEDASRKALGGSSASGQFLQVASEAQAPSDGEEPPKSPIRRLSFSSGMQTLANQIRKTSKRVKKHQEAGGDQSAQADRLDASATSSQINLSGQAGSPARLSRPRRSSSADELSSGQVSTLSLLHKDSFNRAPHDKQSSELAPVIMVTPNSGELLDRRGSPANQKRTSGQKASESRRRRRRSGTSEPKRHGNEADCEPDTEGGMSGGAGEVGAYPGPRTRDGKRSDSKQTDGVRDSSQDDGSARQYLVQNLYTKALRHFESLTRSQTIPANMRFVAAPVDDLRADSLSKSESMGADFYVDAAGRIDPLVVLKVLHSVSQRENACSLRVCERLLFLMNRLINIGILGSCTSIGGSQIPASAPGHTPAVSDSTAYDRSNLLPTKQAHEFNLLHRVARLPAQSRANLRDFDKHTVGGSQIEAAHRRQLIHRVLIDIVFRLHHHLGCPNNCVTSSTVDTLHKQMTLKQKVTSFSNSRNATASGSSHATTLAASSRESPITSGKNLRMSLREALEFLSAFDKENFITYVKGVFNERPMQQVIDILHSLLGFCRADYLSYLKQRASNQAATTAAAPATGQQASSSPNVVQFAAGGVQQQQQQTAVRGQGGVDLQAQSQSRRKKSTVSGAPPQLAGETVECVIVTNSFKQLITRMAGMTKELKMSENNSLYTDVRRLINFVRENYNSIFRSIVLSALIDCAKLLNQQQREALPEHLRAGRASLADRQAASASLTRPSSEEESLAGLGRGEKQRDTKQAVLSTDEEVSTTDTANTSAQHRMSLASQRFQASSPSHGAARAQRQSHGASSSPVQQLQEQEHAQNQQSGGILSLSKAKKKLEQVFGGGGGAAGASSYSSAGGAKLRAQSQPGDEAGPMASGSMGGAAVQMGEQQSTVAEQSCASGAEESSRRASLVGHQSIGSACAQQSLPYAHHHQPFATSAGIGAPLSITIIKQNQMIYETVQAGMSNFGFLMESCLPGDLLDPALLAALLDLKSPIGIRAAVFLECANFVHRCNRGQWPSWMRMNVAAAAASMSTSEPPSHIGAHRQSNAGLLSSSAARVRKSSSIQRTARNNTLMYRAAGRAFYAWAEAVGARLEELLVSESDKDGQVEHAAASSGGQGSVAVRPTVGPLTGGLEGETLLTQDIDFLQPSLGNDSSPFVLKLAACQLLFEVTTFLRETYRYLPPSIVQHHIIGTGGGVGGAGLGALGGKPSDKMSSIYDVSRAVTANRRWSMALSSLGFGQLPATLSSALSGASGGGGGSSTSGGGFMGVVAGLRANAASNSNTIPEQPERRISFILHETKDESMSLKEVKEEEDEESCEFKAQDGTRKKSRDSINPTEGSSSSHHHQYDIQSTTGSEQETAIITQRKPAPATAVQQASRHLSQSSASSAVVVAAATLLRSSGVIESQSSRRKSIKLKKASQERQDKQERKAKFAVATQQAAAAAAASSAAAAGQVDFDEELENSSISDVGGVRRTDSIRSKRRVSGISERSDMSHANGHSAQLGVDRSGQAAGGDLSENESSANGSVADEQGTQSGAGGGAGGGSSGLEGSLSKFEADESKIMSNMPWFKALSLVNASVDCDCPHYPACKSSCYKIHQSVCKRLISFVQSIYQDPTEKDYLSSIFERRLANLISDQKQLHKQQQRESESQQQQKSSGSVVSGSAFRADSDCSGAEWQATGADGSQATRKLGDKKFKKRSRLSDSAQKGSSAGAALSSHSRANQLDDSAVGPLSASGQRLGGSKMQSSSVVDETINILRAAKAKDRHQEEPPMIKYLRSNFRSLLHCPMSAFLKGAIILPRENFAEMIPFSWNLLLEDDQQLARTAAVCFIVSSIKCPSEASKLLADELESVDASRKMAAINKFYVVWDARYQCWPRLEDGAFVHFKMAPPSIEFTLPSPKIAQESSSVVDPPWMPRKTSNVEEVTIGQDQTVQKSFVTATKTRRKQQIEIVTKALREKFDKLREGRENYNITSAPIALYAAFEPTLGSSSQSGGIDEMDGVGVGGNASGSGAGGGASGAGSGGVGGGGGASGGGVGGGVSSSSAADDEAQENRALFQMKTAQALFPTCLCQSAIVMINLLDDPRVTYEGSAVYETACKVIWSCLVEDPALFLRYFFERLTRQNQSTIFQVLRRLIRFMPRLPPQAAYTLYNYLIGFIIYYIRCPFENSQKLISDTLSVLCLVVPSVHGLFLKDLKQILRKEQCDHNLLITANVPSAKKIIVHGSDASGIPSQFPIDESTQFYHILVDSLEFFGIEKAKQNEYFLIDVRTNLMHNLQSYVRDHYSFKRSQHPQLQLINMEPSKAFDILQRQELINQFMEFGKVSMSLSIVKSSHMAVQRALFLHEELMKLPTFPRKALETNFSLFRGPLGHQVFSMDRIHKICWVRVIARMFELTSGFFLQLGDIQLFLNAISGIFVLHCEEASVSRLCLATFINATHQFKSIFAIDGFMPIMSTIVQVYSNHQNNQLLCKSIEFVCKQFYIMHRKPFLLQLFGSVASRLNTAEILQQNQITSPVGLYQPSAQQASHHHQVSSSVGSAAGALHGGAGSNQIQVNDPNRISPSAFFRLLLSLEKAFKDPLDILELVDCEKPLRAVDFCYQQDKESIEILDIISLCVTVTAYASESPRSTQMLIILESVLPLYMKHLQVITSKKAGQSMGKHAHKDELQKIQSVSICIRTLIVNCDGLTRNFNGPLASFDFRSSSIRRTAGQSGTGRGARCAASSAAAHNNNNSPPCDIYADDPSYTGPDTSQGLGPGFGKGAARIKSAAGSSGIGGGGLVGSSGLPGKQTTFAPSKSKAAAAAAAAAASSAAAAAAFNNDENEITRGEFIVPRDTLLNLVADFLALSTGRLVESAKKYVELHQKHSSYELIDVKSHLRLAEVANSLLKFASTDPSVMACRGLIRYMNEILPNTEWRQEAIRPALIMILKRLDKTFNRIAKKNWVRRNTDWEAAKQLLKGAYLTFIKHPYIVHLPHLKSLIGCCQNIILSDGLQSAQAPSSLLYGFASAAAAAVSQQQQLQQQQQQQAASQPPTSGGAATSATSSSGQQPTIGGKLQAGASHLLNVGQAAAAGLYGSKSVGSPSSSSGMLNVAAVAAAAAAGSTSAAALTSAMSSSAATAAAAATPTATGAGIVVSSSAGGQSSGQQHTTGTPSLAGITAAAAFAERLASGTTNASSHLAASSAATSQGFNSVTIRLIAMQLLQTGDSQTLESFIGNSMNTPEKLESLMLNLIYPMCIRVCSGAREAPKLRICDIMFMLNIVLQMLAPQSASSKSCALFASSPKAATDTSQFILSKITTTIGSTQTGATALNIVGGGSSSHSQASAHQMGVQHNDGLKIGFLGLKVLCVCFESQLASEWIRIARVIRDLALLPNQPSGPLWDFLDFVATYRFPLFVLLLPTIKCDISRKVKLLESQLSAGGNLGGGAVFEGVANTVHYRQCLRLIEAKIHGVAPTVCRSKSFLFVSLTAELRMLKEQLIAKRKQIIDGERSQHHQHHHQQQGHHHHSHHQHHGHGHGQQAGVSGGGGVGTGGGNSSGLLGVQSGQAGGVGAGQTGASAATSAGSGLSAPSSNATGGDATDHLGGAYHRLSAAIASFANQNQIGRLSPSASAASSQHALATSAALKGTCFAAQLATSAPIGIQMSAPPTSGVGDRSAPQDQVAGGSGIGGYSQSSIRLSKAKSREEARRVVNTILRRTSYPHNQAGVAPQQLLSSTGNELEQSFARASGARKGSQQFAEPAQLLKELEDRPFDANATQSSIGALTGTACKEESKSVDRALVEKAKEVKSEGRCSPTDTIL